MITSRDNTLGYLHATVSSWGSATLLARWRILICCAMAPLGCRQPSPRSVLREPVMKTHSIHSVGCSMLQYLFFTGPPSPLRNLRNSGASACPFARREQPYVHLFSRSSQPQTRWTLLPSSWIWTPPNPGLKHLVLSRGIISLTRDIPNSDVDLLASRNSLLVRKDLHPALQ